MRNGQTCVIVDTQLFPKRQNVVQFLDAALECKHARQDASRRRRGRRLPRAGRGPRYTALRRATPDSVGIQGGRWAEEQRKSGVGRQFITLPRPAPARPGRPNRPPLTHEREGEEEGEGEGERVM